MNKKNIVNLTLAVAVFVGTLCLVEFGFFLVNRASGVKFPFMYLTPMQSQRGWTGMQAVDGILGYALSETKSNSIPRAFPGHFTKGFLFYGQKPSGDGFSVENLPRPLIVTLGGSTTDPYVGANSWSEELAKLMQEHGVAGTVANGGVYGYSSSQELLKIIRDVLELKPDIVITYHGFNEVFFGTMPYPMTSKYFNRVLDDLTKTGQASTYFPNTTFFVKSMGLLKNQAQKEVSKGFPTGKTHAEFFLRNVELMDLLAVSQGIKHVSILQPYAMTGNYAKRIEKDVAFYNKHIKPYDFMQATLNMYKDVKTILARNATVALYDMTEVFDALPEDSPNVYLDECHLTGPANTLIAEKIYDLLRERKILPAK